MASVDRPGFASFTTLPLPAEPPGPYQTVGLLLKIAGWVRLVQLILVVLVGGLVLLVLAIAGTLGSFFAGVFAGPMGAWGGLATGVVLVIAAGIIIVAAAIAAAFTYWTSWLYARWVAQDSRAPQALFTYALVTTILAGIGVLGIMGGNPGGLVDIGLLVIGILLLVQAQDPQIKQMGAPATAVPEGWKTVE